MNLEKTGSLEAIVTKGNPQAPTIIICHGYGADAYDLAPLKDHFVTPQECTWVFPNGPETVPIGPHSTGRAWFEIDVDALMRAQMVGEHRDLSQETPRGLSSSRKQIEELIFHLKSPFEKTIMGGFSQGAMLATSVSLEAQQNPLGLIIMSGSILDENHWNSLAPKHKGLKFYQSHGAQDPILSLSGAEKLESLLKRSGLEGELQKFSGGHEIPWSVIQGVNNYMHKILSCGT